MTETGARAAYTTGSIVCFRCGVVDPLQFTVINGVPVCGYCDTGDSHRTTTPREEPNSNYEPEFCGECGKAY